MKKKEDKVIITYEKVIESCEECDYSDYDNLKLVCCADKLPKKYITRTIDDDAFDNDVKIPKWCPYRRKKK